MKTETMTVIAGALRLILEGNGPEFRKDPWSQ